MDIIATLRNKISTLSEGPHSPGLKAVLLHIETADRHLQRGQETGDDTAFTDAIYRTNQAFEGSIKEAYRVLAEQDPDKKRPYEIERYMERNKIFKQRVLNLLKNYRTDWRNPSAHDYKLDFDDSEAFLAIVSVAAFGCVLVDQIIEQISFAASQEELKDRERELSSRLAKGTLLGRTTDAIKEFCAHHFPEGSSPRTEAQVLGALRGFISTAMPDVDVASEVSPKSEPSRKIDLVLSVNKTQVFVEIKRNVPENLPQQAIVQIEAYLYWGDIKNGILLLYPENQTEMEVSKIDFGDGVLTIIMPRGGGYEQK